MIQCSECEFFHRDTAGRATFKCDPFSTIKEPSCIDKLKLVKEMENGQKLDRIVRAYEATLAMYQRLQPMQEKIMEHMEREITDTEQGDSWKYGMDDEDPENDAPDEQNGF